MAISRSLVLVTCALLSAPALAGAQQAPTAGALQAPPARDARDLPIEVSPFVSSSGNTPADPLRGTLENNGVNGNVNLVYDLPAIGRVRPFVLGGGGLEHYAFLVQPEPYFLSDTGVSFVVNVGGGVRVAINDRFGIRTEVRWADGWTKGAPTGSLRIFYGATVGVGGR